ncbi:uncharacterized protein E0L32_000998 [Thyridium curvatum]|uniref:Chitin deacetylase n=1 Tax=Thyridium curvatum TaxID=1093900 RepID=A0A507B3K8_9PEZI|nr:uncharacterized protein E0L32_000998 [Thyridium curvatum]TPX11180.1 hypothetical protein E0L32_000998 [Thyridium curvatum]
MHWSTVVVAALAGIATAHGGDDHLHGLPKIVGGRKILSELRARRFEPGRAPPPNVARAERNQASEGPSLPPLGRRQNGGTSGRCGPGRGSCAGGYCCSAEGWCGLTEEYCSSPDCQINYGSGCDGNQRPSGVDTSTVARPHLGDVLYGGLGIYDCDKAGDIALTFDDGPYDYTGDLLDKFADYGAKATFFITGNNLGKGMINDASKPWAGFIKRMIAEGHQVASHTWSHENSSAVSQQQWRDQMIYNEIAFNDILGFFPTYMRPPYSICEKTCQTILSALGYHVVYFDLDTEGYLHDDPSAIQDSKDIWDDAVGPSRPARDSFLQIEHDIHWQSVYNLTDYFLTSLFAKGYRSVTRVAAGPGPPAPVSPAAAADVHQDVGQDDADAEDENDDEDNEEEHDHDQDQDDSQDEHHHRAADEHRPAAGALAVDDDPAPLRRRAGNDFRHRHHHRHDDQVARPGLAHQQAAGQHHADPRPGPAYHAVDEAPRGHHLDTAARHDPAAASAGAARGPARGCARGAGCGDGVIGGPAAMERRMGRVF